MCARGSADTSSNAKSVGFPSWWFWRKSRSRYVYLYIYIERERHKLYTYHYPCSLYVLFSHIIIKKIKMNIMWPLGVPAPWALLGVLSSCQLRWSRNWPVCSCWYLLKLDFHLHCFGLSDPKLASFNSGLRPSSRWIWVVQRLSQFMMN